jgi:hypothetical protein
MEIGVIYEDVAVLRSDGFGIVCVIEGRRLFVGDGFMLSGTTAYRAGTRGRLVVPKWFAAERGLPLPPGRVAVA